MLRSLLLAAFGLNDGFAVSMNYPAVRTIFT